MNRLVRLLCLSLVASSAIAVPAAERADPESDVKAKFQEYIDRIDENSIQHALQLFDKYRHGVSHSENDVAPAQSSSLSSRMNLAKRDGNSSSAVEPTQSTAAPTTTQAPPTETTTSQNDPTTSAGSSGPSTTTDQSPTVPTTSIPTSSSTSNEPTTTKPSTTSKPSSTTERTSTSSSSSSSTEAPTTMKTSTTTDEPTTTRAPRTSTYKSTTTLPNGQPSTVTHITVVHPTETSVAGTTTGPAPGLQTDSSASTASFTRELWLMVGGAAMVAMAL